jgi:hypothetical protein
MSLRVAVCVLAVGAGVVLTAAPAAAQRTGTGTPTGALSNLSTAQLLAAITALQKLSTDSGVSLNTLASAAGITLPGGIGGTGGSTTPPTLTDAQRAAVQADLQALADATGVPVSQLSAIAAAAGLTTSTGGTGTGTGGGNTNNGGGTTTGPTTGPTSGGSTGGRTTTFAAAVPFPEIARPMLFGQRMPADVQEVLFHYSADMMQFLLDEYDFQPATPTEWLYNFMTVFDNKAAELWPDGYVRPGLAYWLLRSQGLVE